MRTYLAKNGATQFKPSMHDIEQADDDTGFCLACGHTQDGVEPDARKYKCEACGVEKVYGFEELALMGLCYDDTPRDTVDDTPTIEDTMSNEQIALRNELRES